MASSHDEPTGNRLKNYKPIFKDIGESRRLRVEAGVKLRKDKREKEVSVLKRYKVDHSDWISPTNKHMDRVARRVFP